MDSVMKESQRHHFGDITAMGRLADETVKLSDGSVIPKGAFTMVSLEKMRDDSIFTQPDEFIGSRFLKFRQRPGQENKWHFVSTSPEHLTFGLGEHACPGRFFAGTEVMIALCHLLLKYDWKLTKDGRKKDRLHDQIVNANPTVTVLIKRRKQEASGYFFAF
ncbi:cytochrome P450 [Colletotrichum tofieldiae]|uniref:Cytochrome P450 n=1 Tax=Colletotrichum tofieldiae TaxID=708197 RepID=A0A166V3X6_9PEZI|nr:cytochrome P450 [Colletotrichum tofieldiae]GKT70597.1 cytochrome P450 [Colletotrichum tofieldiae]